jgi:ribosomal protein S18 acetylase RimI-like enzyme
MSFAMNVFRATVEHLDELADLFDQYRIFYEQDSDYAGCRKFMADRLEKDQAIIIAARGDEGLLVGFTQLYRSFCSVELKPLVYLYDLFVDPAARRSGVARALMDAAKQYAQLHGADRIQLETAISNTQAQALYEDLGYEKDMEFFTYNLAL